MTMSTTKAWSCLLLLLHVLYVLDVSGKCIKLEPYQQAECSKRISKQDIDTCRSVPTIFLLGPTRNGKSHFANALLAYSSNIFRTDFEDDDDTPPVIFKATESGLSQTSSIKCVCGDKYRVCDSPGIPDLCNKADEYLDKVVQFLKNEKPALILFVIDQNKDEGDMLKTQYYQALKHCVTEFSSPNTFIVLNSVTRSKKKRADALPDYIKKMRFAFESFKIPSTNYIFHKAQQWWLTKEQQELFDNIPQPSIKTSHYKTYSELVSDAAKGINYCTDNIISRKEQEIQIKQDAINADRNSITDISNQIKNIEIDKNWHSNRVRDLSIGSAVSTGLSFLTLGISAIATMGQEIAIADSRGKLSKMNNKIEGLNDAKHTYQRNIQRLESEIQRLKAEIRALQNDVSNRLSTSECQEYFKALNAISDELCVDKFRTRDRVKREL